MTKVNEISNLKGDTNFLFDLMEYNDHESLFVCNDNETGLKAIIAVHNTILGPALGGTRVWNYSNESDAFIDVLRLSRGMTYKNALAGLDLGGGKAVIIGDPHATKSKAMMRKFGKFVNKLGGVYITAEDVGITPTDMQHVHAETNFVVGLPGKSGDPSPVTARGVYMGMKACAKQQFGSDSLTDKKIVVQGIGHVGKALVDALTKEGAKVYVSDIYKPTLQEVAKEYNVTIVEPNELYDLEMDIYAPCALGATINDNTLDRLKCSIIAGAANNQLEDEKKHGEKVMQKGIIYAPDYAINAGGVINCYVELKDLSAEWAIQKADQIYETITKILKRASDEKMPSYQIANRIAEERIQEKRYSENNL